jgi:hypothetical protein
MIGGPDRAVSVKPYGTAAGRSSPDALGVVRNLPGAVAGGARHPVVSGSKAGLDRQQDLEHGGRGLVDVLALRQVPGGRRIVRFESPPGGGWEPGRTNPGLRIREPPCPRRKSAADVRLDGDEMAADADDGNALHVSSFTIMATLSLLVVAAFAAVLAWVSVRVFARAAMR